jgi:hypothetical protein
MFFLLGIYSTSYFTSVPVFPATCKSDAAGYGRRADIFSINPPTETHRYYDYEKVICKVRA